MPLQLLIINLVSIIYVSYILVILMAPPAAEIVSLLALLLDVCNQHIQLLGVDLALLSNTTCA